MKPKNKTLQKHYKNIAKILQKYYKILLTFYKKYNILKAEKNI